MATLVNGRICCATRYFAVAWHFGPGTEVAATRSSPKMVLTAEGSKDADLRRWTQRKRRLEIEWPSTHRRARLASSGDGGPWRSIESGRSPVPGRVSSVRRAPWSPGRRSSATSSIEHPLATARPARTSPGPSSRRKIALLYDARSAAEVSFTAGGLCSRSCAERTSERDYSVALPGAGEGEDAKIGAVVADTGTIWWWRTNSL